MTDFFRDIFEYHHHFNQKLTDYFIQHLELVSERTVPLFSHCLNAHQIWNARITGSEMFGVMDVHDPKDFNSIDTTNYDNTLNILDERSLDEFITYKNSKGDQFSNSIQQILFHVSNHFTHHKGQLISDLRAQGVTPLVTDYIFYKR